MNASLSWIKAYVPDLDCTYQEFADAMTMSGTKVESYSAFDKNLEKIVTGLIKKIEKHPNADKLVVCQVDLGKGQSTQIVTGATNVFEGAKVPVVLAGGKVAGGHDGGPLPEDGIRIKAGKLRGIESNGMMCSIEELGSSREMFPDAAEDGIYILPDDTEVGSDPIELLGLHDANFEFEITSNRVDCYSVLGIAREAAATFRLPFNNVDPEIKNQTEDISDYLSVEVADTDLCKRYCAKVVKNIRIAPSPDWMQKRLRSCGIRPINNIVDITNYVMEEFGQPMHAFNYDAIAGHKIIVKRASDGDTFQTLDGQMRKLDGDMLMICDSEKPIGLAGIMGGEDSKIEDDIKTMVFESAVFDGTNNRLSARRLGLRTDASGKYEKGLDPNNACPAILRACQLVEELGAGDVIDGIIDIYPEPVDEKQIAFDSERINAYLGTDIPEETMLSYFPALEIGYDPKTKLLSIPTFRQDLLRGADIAEEVARFYGYDNIPVTLPSSTADHAGLTFGFVLDKLIRRCMCSYGYSESMTYSFESPKVFDKLLIPEGDVLRDTLKISNPLGEDYSIMRTTLLGGFLSSLAANYNKRNKKAALFEIGKVYLPAENKYEDLPDERKNLIFGFYGEGDFYTLKGALEELFGDLGLKGQREYLPDESMPFLHPGRQAAVTQNRKYIAYLGELHPVVARNFGLGGRVYVACVDIKAVENMVHFEKKFSEIPRYPAVTRDLSLLMKDDVMSAEVEVIIRKCSGRLLEDLELFDVYQGDNIEKGYKSLAYSLTYRAKDRTLTEEEVNPIIEKTLVKLKEKGIDLRK